MNYKIKYQLAQDIQSIFCFPEISLNDSKILNLFERPKDFQKGHLALPVFFLSQVLKTPPVQIAQSLAQKIQDLELSYISRCQSLSGFVNFEFTAQFLTESLREFCLREPLGYALEPKNKKIVIDYSSPNVAKPMNVGHLRATVIGQAIRNLAVTQGYEVVGLNHLGDWGVQFGKLAWAYFEWGSEYDFKNQPFQSLYEIYVRFHREAESSKDLDQKGAQTFIRLEEGDPEIVRLWKMFVDISMKEYQRLWDRLGVKHDLVRGESFYSDHLEPTIKLLEEKGLLKESQGAFVVEMGEGETPCLIKKSDGASLYATRDIASAIYRHDVLGCDTNFYVVGVDQTLHFDQVFKTLKLMGFHWAKDCHHISFGMYRFKGQGKMSTRKGRAIFLEDVLNKAVDLVKDIIAKKNPDLKNKDEIAEQVGVGAVIFNDLVNDRVKDVDFNWDKVLDFEGDSGPYIQYTQVRCLSVMEKFQVQKKESHFPQNYHWKGINFKSEETYLIASLLYYESVLRGAYERSKPNILAHYLLNLSQAYNSFYNKYRILNAENPQISENRVLLTQHTQKVLSAGLQVLNISSPSKM